MKGDGRVAESCMFVGPGALGRAVELDSLDAGEEPVQHEPDFEPREVRSETEVAAGAEREVRVRRPADVEPFRRVERPRVEVGGLPPQHDLVAGADRAAV